MGEEWEECASRELREETGIEMISNSFRHVYTLNSMSLDNNYHNISCIMYNELDSKDICNVKNSEPHKCAGWFWVTFVEMRTHIDKLFFPLRDFLGRFPDLNNVGYLKQMIKPNGVSTQVESSL